MATRYDPAFCSRKRLAHLALRSDVAVDIAAKNPDDATRLAHFFADRGMAVARRFRRLRAQQILDIRRARGDALEAAGERGRWQWPILYVEKAEIAEEDVRPLRRIGKASGRRKTFRPGAKQL